MADIIVVLIVLAIIGAAVFYIRKEKKRGVVCIGCPHAGECARKHGAAGCSCSSPGQDN